MITVKTIVKWSVFTCFLVLVSRGQYSQDDYLVKLERIDLVKYDPSYVSHPKYNYGFVNRSMRAMNASGYLLKDLAMDFKAQVQVLKFMSNEYRFFPITLKLSACDEIRQNHFGVHDVLSKSSNVTVCPIKKGFYVMHHCKVDFSKFPPFIPEGRYKAEITLVDRDVSFLEIHFYAIVQSIIKKWET